MKRKNILIKGGMIFTGKTLKKADMLISRTRIEKIAQSIRKQRTYKVIDATDRVIMPGFICAHHHLYSTFARGMFIPGKPARNFVQILKKLWWKLDRNLNEYDLYLSSLYALSECIRWGVTTIVDHHESQSFQIGSLDVIMHAVEHAGIRACLTLGVSDRYSRGKNGLWENIRFLKKLKCESHPLIRGMVGLHACFTVNNETLEQAVQIAKNYNCGLHLHVAEARSDQLNSLIKHKTRVVNRLKKFGALGKKTILVHCVHVNDTEMSIIKKTDSIVVHNPESNMNNGVGWADILKMMRRGILVGLGTDGMSSNMLQQVRCAYLIAKNEKRDPRVAFVQAPAMLLQNNARIARRLFNLPLGQLKEGAPADIIILPYMPPTPFNSGNFLGHLLFGITQSTVETTIANGRILMEKGKIKTLDIKKISIECMKSAKDFWQKFQNN